MEITGEHRFRAEAERVWRALLDPEMLREALPGCEEFEAIEPDTYRVRLRVGVPGLSGTFEGKVTVRGREGEGQYRVTVFGEAFGNRTTGDAELAVRPTGNDRSVLRYRGLLRPHGRLARGSFVLKPASKLLAGQFFRAMERQLAQHSRP